MTMKRNNYFYALWIVVSIVVLGDIVNFLYAGTYCFNAYPILPFNVYPSYCRGTNRYCNSMEGIFDMGEYTDECEMIEPWIERPRELDSLCIYSILKYAWKKDSLLMEVSIKDGSTRWLLASPASSSKYKCKLQEIKTPSSDYIKSYHRITLYADTPKRRTFDALMEFVLRTIHIILILLIPMLNLICLILTIKNCIELDATDIVFRKIYQIIFMLFTTFMPRIVLFVIRKITFATLLQ